MKLYGLIGYPLGHSFSKQYFTEKFQREGIVDATFELFPLQQIQDFPQLINTLPDLSGLCVTIPYKEAIIPYLNRIEDKNNAIAAVNCIKIKEGKLIGYNTDVIGFENSLKPYLQSHPQKALILGTGGASKAVQFVLKKLSIDFLVVSRKPVSEHSISYNQLNQEIIHEHTIIINCTPLGMTPHIEELPLLPYSFIGKEHLLYDLVYTPSITTFLEKGRMQGATIKNGEEMLHVQAEANWQIWNEK
jgi:shikimate dehydrogenase